MEVNTTAAHEHVPEVEPMIRTVKQRLRSVTSDFPFSPIPKMVLIHSVYYVIIMLNTSPRYQGVTGVFLSRELVTGRMINNLRDFRATVGAYIEASRDAMVTNGQENRTHPCITLGTSRTIKWTDILTKKSNTLGKKSKYSVVKEDIKLLNRHVHRFEWDNGNMDEIEVIR